MGQPVVVIEKTTSKPGVLCFETNRALTGMGHRSYASKDDFRKKLDPADLLAQRLFESGQVDYVHLHGNMVTVEVTGGSVGTGLKEIVEDLYSFYKES